MSNPLAAAKIDSTKNNHVDTNFKELDKITHQEITLNIFM
jgi:hypothetical protein